LSPTPTTTAIARAMSAMAAAEYRGESGMLTSVACRLSQHHNR
jgi:hypothetical protein